MRRLGGVVSAAALAVALPAWAQSEKPLIGPAPSWVLPPAETTGAKDAAAAVQTLFSDQQQRFDGETTSRYAAFRTKILQPAALTSMGNLSFQWSPATETLTFHRLRILRGGQVIDCLPKDGAFTVVRREERLDESAELNGELTAVLQPQGLQVGDVLDVAYTVQTTDPVFRGDADARFGASNGGTVDHLRMRALWPTRLPIRWRVTNSLPQPRLSSASGQSEAVIELDDVKPLVLPQGAPARFRRGREFSLSTYSDWSTASAKVAPLFEAASRLQASSPLTAEARKIAAQTQDPVARAGLALALVEQQVRYVADEIGENGWKPAPADLTWTRRWGDCKGKTVLLVALLRELDIAAEPVLVAADGGDDFDERLPSPHLFNHVIVRADLGGKERWLDATRLGDDDVTVLTTPDFGWGLPLRSGGASLARIRPEPLASPTASVIIAIDASKGRDAPAKVHGEMVTRGEVAALMRVGLAAAQPDQLTRMERQIWQKQFNDLEIASVSTEMNGQHGEVKLIVDGQMKLDWNGGYEPTGAYIGFTPDLHREAGPDADAPFRVAFPTYEHGQVSIVLPDGGRGYRIVGQNVDRTLLGVAYRRRAEITGGVFRMEVTTRAVQPEIGFKQAQAEAPALTEMARTTLKLAAPSQTVASAPAASAKPKTVKELQASEPTTRDGYLKRANDFLNVGRADKALEDYDKAVSLDPGSGLAFAGRGVAHAWLHQKVAAEADLDHAEALDPGQVVIWHGRGILASSVGDTAGAIKAYTRALDLNANDSFALMQRANAFAAAKDYPKALADMDEAIRQEPPALWAQAGKVNIQLLQKNYDAALVGVDAVAKAGATPEQVAQLRTKVQLARRDYKAAVAEAEKLVLLKPTAQNLFIRAAARDPDDLNGREADAKAALAKDPKHRGSLDLLRWIAEQRRDFAAAEGWAAKAGELTPEDDDLAIRRVGLRFKAGADRSKTAADYAAIRSKAVRKPVLLNNLCYGEANVGFDLDQALSDCDASLKVAPDVPATLDSRAFVLMRLGRDREALEAYDRALAGRPDQAESLFGKGLVEARLGLTADAERDRRAAIDLSPRIEKVFADYGVTR